jgi:hypothetical protein
MSRHMRTTVRLDDGLLEQARAEARRRGETLTSLIEKGLRHELTNPKPAGKRPWVELPVFESSGVMPGVDLTNNASLLDIMEEGLPLHKLR